MPTEPNEMAEDQPLAAAEAAAALPVTARCRELAELEVAIRRRLRSNQRFLERFLDEDFVDDEDDDGEEQVEDRDEL
jgi:hypothetical protein